MPTYIYECLGKNGEITRFEVRQSIHEAPLTSHPQTGEPVRRVITGGLGYLKIRSGGNVTPDHSGSSPGNCCPGCHD